MGGNKIPLGIKVECVRRFAQGQKPCEIYSEYFQPIHSSMSESTFIRVLRKWRKEINADSFTLMRGTYDGFYPHDATVQVNGNGEITQAWIKQTANEVDWDEIISQFNDKIEPIEINAPEQAAECMLEIPLFDMHFGVAKFDNYSYLYDEIIKIISSKDWEQINILIGQDLIHNNDMRGHTAKGTEIERVDIPKAWNDAWHFWNGIIVSALKHSQTVIARYSKGNHDECISWAFLKTLQAQFPDLVIDDSLKARKVLNWRGCFIGYGHCEYTNKPDDLFKQFVMDFPQEFAESKVREIHTGHLHRESVDNGIFVRRLASAVPVDEWHDNNGYVTAHKRFQIFEWIPGRLKAIYYL